MSEENKTKNSLRQKRAEAANKNKKQKLILSAVFAMLALFLVVALAAFNGAFEKPTLDNPLEAQAESEAGSQTRPAATDEKQVVTDSVGREVTVPAQPVSIAALDSFAGELLVMVGAGNRICGVPGGVISNTLLQKIYPELSSAPLRLSGNAVNIESLLETTCDVALVRSTLSKEERTKLDTVGIPYVVVAYETMEDQIAAIRLVGQVCGGEIAEKAEALAKYYEDTVAEVEERAARIPESEQLRVYHSINDILLTDGAGSLGADWVARAGAINVAAGEAPTSGSDFSTSIEQVYNWNPDIIICNVAATAKDLPGNAQWQGLEAVSEGRIHNIPVGATRWGQRGDVETYFALLWLGTTIYPEYFDDINLKDRVVSHYRDFLGIEVDDALYETILSGEGIRTEGTGGGDGSGGGGTGGGTGGGRGGM